MKLRRPCDLYCDPRSLWVKTLDTTIKPDMIVRVDEIWVNKKNKDQYLDYNKT